MRSDHRNQSGNVDRKCRRVVTAPTCSPPAMTCYRLVMAWLVHDGTVLASVERADSVRSRTLGLLGRDEIHGALVLDKTKSVHTIGMKFPIDVAFCDDEMRVLRIVTMPKHRVSKIEFGAACAIETTAGRFNHWKIQAGAQLEIRDTSSKDSAITAVA